MDRGCTRLTESFPSGVKQSQAIASIVVDAIKDTSYALRLVGSKGQAIPADDLPSLLEGDEPFPTEMVHVYIFPKAELEVASPESLGLARQTKQAITIECTELGGHDLGGPRGYDVCIRTDKHNTYMAQTLGTPVLGN